MWKYYDNIPGHVPHWRYEVDGKWHIGYMPSNVIGVRYRLISVSKNGTDVRHIGLPGPDATGVNLQNTPEFATTEELNQWLEMAWRTGALENL